MWSLSDIRLWVLLVLEFADTYNKNSQYNDLIKCYQPLFIYYKSLHAQYKLQAS